MDQQRNISGSLTQWRRLNVFFYIVCQFAGGLVGAIAATRILSNFGHASIG
jgi:hypothetical protein